MNHHGYWHPQAPNDVPCNSMMNDRFGCKNSLNNQKTNELFRFGATNARSGYEGANNDNNNENDPGSDGFLSSAKRRRESHIIIASSQDDDYYYCGEDPCENDIASMGHYHDTAGPTKRQRLAYTFPFGNDGQIITQQRQEPIHPKSIELTAAEAGADMGISKKDETAQPVEWWRKKNPPVISAIPTDAVASSPRSIVEQEALSACSAMDTTNGDDEICCHVCQNFFPLPTVPTVREVMPANALLNYFSPVKKIRNSNGDIDMVTEEGIPHRMSRTSRSSSNPCAKSLASCPCCDRPTCSDCRQRCQTCQRSFCVFCSITRDDFFAHGPNNIGTFCLHCHDLL